MTLVIASILFACTYITIASERFNRTYVAVGGALLVLAFGLLDTADAFRSSSTGIDWAVLALLLGMMIIVGVFVESGVFDYIGATVSQRFRSRPGLLVAVLFAITSCASALLDNVTTVLLIVPMTIQVCQRMRIDPVPVVIGVALASNIGGAGTLIGDPPNIIIGGKAGLGYGDFLLHAGPAAAGVTGMLLLAARWFTKPERHEWPHAVPSLPVPVVRDPRLVGLAGAVLAGVTAAFLLQSVLHRAPSVVALSGAGLLLLLTRESPQRFLRHVAWETLVFFAGLFVLVGALVKTGAIDAVASWLQTMTSGSAMLGASVLLVASGLISGIVDNIPYVTAMTPITMQLVHSLPRQSGGGALWWALALGADFGGNATIIGASANIVAVGLASKAGYTIRFRDFVRYGLPVTVGSIAFAWVYVYLRYFAFTTGV